MTINPYGSNAEKYWLAAATTIGTSMISNSLHTRSHSLDSFSFVFGETGEWANNELFDKVNLLRHSAQNRQERRELIGIFAVSAG